MIDYYSLIADAVANLGNGNTAERRRDIYSRGRNLLIARLASLDREALSSELAAFEGACNRIEAGAHDLGEKSKNIRLRKLDITKLAWRWRIIQFMSIVAMLYAFDGTASTLLDIGKYVFSPASRTEIDYSTILPIAFFVLCLYVAHETWVCASMMQKGFLKRLRLMYWAIISFYIAFGGLSMYYIYANLSIHSFGDFNTDGQNTIVLFFLYLVVAIVYILLCIVVLSQIRIFIHGHVDKFGLALDSFHKAMEAHETIASREARWIVRLDQPFGLLWIISGVVIFVLGAGLYNFAVSYTFNHLGTRSSLSSNEMMGIGKISTAIEVVGGLCLVKGRSYFLPTAEAVLALDKRDPILYLRSFADEGPSYKELTGGFQFLDRSLEMKLSRYFNSFGPFVAIGSQADRLPKLGAIRLRRSDQDWQDEVASLMADSRTIVAAVGITPWIKWELSEIVRRRYVDKTIFLFPVTAKSAKERTKQQALRIQVMNELTQQEIDHENLGLEKSELLLSLVVKGDRIIVITSKKFGSNDKFLAAIVAHYILIDSEHNVERDRVGVA
jgi:hypothetical protein